MAPTKVLDPDNINENIKKLVYAVRGELYIRASELQKEGKKVCAPSHVKITIKRCKMIGFLIKIGKKE